jgi:uncharacterized Zn-finger protein
MPAAIGWAKSARIPGLFRRPDGRPIIPETIMADSQTVEITVRCPPIDTAARGRHPRVHLDVLHGAVRPYCGTRYAFKGKAPERR